MSTKSVDTGMSLGIIITCAGINHSAMTWVCPHPSTEERITTAFVHILLSLALGHDRSRSNDFKTVNGKEAERHAHVLALRYPYAAKVATFSQITR